TRKMEGVGNMGLIYFGIGLLIAWILLIPFV
ncbi:hypothetical protein LCGC14_3158640, partial [marine sediment metagenome]